jgi:ornithine carbamoyltransferase
MRHLVTLADLDRTEIERIFAITEDLKSKFADGLREPLLPGRVAALLFEKPSLRTRVSFESAMIHLGGSSLFLGSDVGWGSRECISDFARVLSQYVDVIIVRSFAHQSVLDLAEHSSCPVINGLTDYAHPCQALADLFTLKELLGALSGHTLTYIGDGNNVARSLAVGCGRVGMRMVLASPEGYQFDAAFRKRLKKQVPHLELTETADPVAAVKSASAVYTDVWASMGQESEADVRRRDFAAYQVNAKLMKHAPADCYFMHCLPAHRGEEVADDVIDSPQSIVLQQAGNRLHVQKGILAWLLGSLA